LMRLMDDADLREKMGCQAAEYALQYDWKLIAERMVKVYEKLLK